MESKKRTYSQANPQNKGANSFDKKRDFKGKDKKTDFKGKKQDFKGKKGDFKGKGRQDDERGDRPAKP
jgi:hypothetical protein